MDLERFEPLTSRMRTERSPMRTLKKPPKDKTFLLKNGKKVTLQEKCASDVI